MNADSPRRHRQLTLALPVPGRIERISTYIGLGGVVVTLTSIHFDWRIPTGIGVAIMVTAALVTTWQQRKRKNAWDETTAEAAAGAPVWQTVAERVMTEDDPVVRQRFIHAAERITGQTTPGPLLDAGPTDHLPAGARSVRIYGPVGSGKTVAARAVVRRAVAAGRPVTVINGSNEYDTQHLGTNRVTVIDAAALRTESARHAVATRLAGPQGNDDELVLVDPVSIGLHDAELADLVQQLHRALSIRTHTTLVCITSRADGFSTESGDVIDFDTEIVLPGRPGRPVPLHVLQRLSSDDFTIDRLGVLLNDDSGFSRYERRIVELMAAVPLPPAHLTKIVENRLPTVEVGLPAQWSVQIRHGIMKTPRGPLSEYVLPQENSTPQPPLLTTASQ